MTERVFRGPDEGFVGEMAVPGDKSLSHRALILAAMAEGRSRVAGLGPGADIAATARCLHDLGVDVEADAVVSAGVDGWLAPARELDAGNSGTTMRLLTGALSGRPFPSRIVGDHSLMARPMSRLVRALGSLGAGISVSPSGTAPIDIKGGALRGAEVEIAVPSAQVRSAVALAALQAAGPSSITSPPGFRDHTERWLSSLGLGMPSSPTTFRVEPGTVPTLDLAIPGDPSSAAYLWATAALGGGTVTKPAISLNPGRTGFLDVLEAMGASVTRRITGEVLGDPVGDVVVSGPVTNDALVSGELTTRALDELPLVALLGTAAPGGVSVSDAAELRVKESDRIATTVAMVRSLGGNADETPDGFTVRGGGLRAGAVDAGGDHRLAMAGAVAATTAGEVAVSGFEAANISWPGVESALESLWSSR